jgi:hypothetical protein
MRRAVVLGVAVLMALIPAGAAWARGGGWQPLTFSPFDWQCGTTTVHVTFPVNDEYERVTVLQDGTQVIKTSGNVVVNLTTDSGASVTEDIAGPGDSLAFPNGDFEFRATGINMTFLTPDQSSSTGLPEIFTTSGPIDDIIKADGTFQVLHLPKTITDNCSQLT